MKYIKLFEQFVFDSETINCFDNQTLTTVQLLPHTFIRSGKDVICEEKVEFDESKPSILLLPGGDGKPAVDFEHISKDLTRYNLFSMNYIQDEFGNIDTWSRRMAESALQVIPGEFSIVGFSLGTSIGFFAIRDVFNKSNRFTKKFVCIDAGLPPETSGNAKDDFNNKLNSFMELNPPLKYSIIRKSKIDSETLDSDDQLEFRYGFKSKFDWTKMPYKIDDFQFDYNKEKQYQDWRSKQKMVFEYLDDPKKSDRSHTFVSGNPSSVYIDGELIVNDKNEVDLELAEKRQEELKIGDENIWIVRDKWEGDEEQKKQFWFEKNYQNLLNWSKKHVKDTGQTIGEGEKITPGVKVLYLKAEGTSEKMTPEDKAKLEENPLTKKPSDTQFKYIENCTHGNMLEDKKSSAQISSFIIEFLEE
jgi:hypothetical protein